MNAEILAIGTELLLGDILNTNAQYLSKQLASLGISVFYQTVVGDNPERVVNAFNLAFSRADIVITTGGLGPTKDDLSKEMAAKYFNKKLVLSEKWLKHMTEYMEKQGFTVTENNKKQALVIEDSQIMENEVGTAPGTILESDGKILIMFPGPPFEMHPMFEKCAMPFLKEKTKLTFVSKTLRVCGVGESMAEDMLKELIDNQTNPTIAPYAKTSEVHFRVTSSAKSEEEAQDLMKPVVDKIYKILGSNIYGEDDQSLEETVVKILAEKGLKIACAESCTGGLLTATLVNVPDVSNVLVESVVTYSNEAKINRINVSKETLEKFGAVSKETAEEMAKGVCEISGADVGVSITGIAGPSGGSDEKPVGLVHIAVYYNNKFYSKQIRILGDRQKVRNRTVVITLDFIRRILLNIDEL